MGAWCSTGLPFRDYRLRSPTFIASVTAADFSHVVGKFDACVLRDNIGGNIFLFGRRQGKGGEKRTQLRAKGRPTSAFFGERTTVVYEKDGEKYFVLDGHVHYWDASPENWIEGQEQYARGWIECFYGYHQLGPEEYYWPMEKYQKYSEETMMKDLFEDGYVDMAIFLPTYLMAWYKEGFNTTERDAILAEKYPDRFILNSRFDPRDGEEGLEEFERKHEKYGFKGVKLYTAEWHNGSKGWSLTDPEAGRYLEKCEELGVTNIHVHKGPTIWPLNKDAFDPIDVDDAATSFPNLNFIVEHVGLPRIEEFCFMATQEPNVYAGLSVALGALMHSRPRFFSKVMGELLFWVGEDKMLWASDYAIWHPRWQVEMFVDWDYPEGHEYDDFPRLSTEGKKKILGLNAARLYDIEVPPELRLQEAETDAQSVEPTVS
jgi:uncharacterized protein